MLEGFMELRGVGIINVSRMYGVGAVAHETQIEFQIDLEPFNDSYEYDRVGIEEKEYNEILGIKILKMTIPVSQGRPISSSCLPAASLKVVWAAPWHPGRPASRSSR